MKNLYVAVQNTPLGSKGGEQHSLAGEVVGGPNSDDWIEAVALFIFSGLRGRGVRKKPSTGVAQVQWIIFILGSE
jgi:hypothetical protein